ncbi:MAG: class I SAM-dependent DNA methyltransferase [Bacteriovoracaceae bacterium]|nr:class I SAM-dependent DNA methyltransferase [Bacteriovoracaceae bacterium]
MNITQIEDSLKTIIKSINKESFIYEFLLAYGLPKASITRLKKGNLNLSKVDGEVSWKKKLLFKEIYNEDLHISVTELASNIKQNQRFVIVTDYKTLLAIDTKTTDKLEIALKDLPKHYDFFLPWAGMEKHQHQGENPADVKAAERLAKLFDEIKKDNPDDSEDAIHFLNVFLSRLLFCYFAEDTHIFEEGQFTNAIGSHTQTDGSDLNTYLDKLFTVLDTSDKDRKSLPAYLEAFPYVNGGLFAQKLKAPKFTRRSRQALIDSGELDWSAINPDIFGSMIQAVITPAHRGGLGMHYTSVPNIMKVIEPLFLNELKEEFEKANGNQKKYSKLLNRLHKIKIFDPACGSGNFLIIAYKELRKLEMEIFKKSQTLALSGIKLSQFYGIELDDFAHEIAKLSLWLAEHQMNVHFFKEFGRTNPPLPLKDAGNITHGNACRVNWETVCPKNEDDEIYILGNPPYQGKGKQSLEQKKDMAFVFDSFTKYKSLDFIACWFFLAGKYITCSNSKSAFVTTNSISQGQQVSLLWPFVINNFIEIGFAHKSFLWTNNAKREAKVIVSIISLRNRNSQPKYIFSNNRKQLVQNINSYLLNSKDIYINSRMKQLSHHLPCMVSGSKPNDDGNLMLSKEEKDELIRLAPKSRTLLRKVLGSAEFIRQVDRYCLWIDEDNKELAMSITLIKERLNATRAHRLRSKNKAAHISANTPYKFYSISYKEAKSIIIPSVSSERRKYVPIGFIEKDVIVTNLAFVIYEAEPYLLSILSSRIHISWMKAVSGKMKMDYRYSSVLVYNTFPFPPISTQRKDELTQTAFRILEEREKHPEKTLAQLYDPNKMPKGLKEAHKQNDLAVEKCYRSTPFSSDEDRLEYLFNLYEKMIAEEQAVGTLFAIEKKSRKKKK